MAKLDLKNLTKRYASVTAVDDLSLTVEHGQVLSLLGPSGCGKTTTLHMLAGFLQPDQGEILVDGNSIQNLPPERRNSGIVFQNYALFPHMSVAANIGFGLEMRKIDKSEIDRRVARAIDLVHLGGLMDRYPRQLSGGQQQRVALARALVIEPSFLLLDEPLSNLDASLREEMRFEIREIQRRVGITTVFVTHDQEEAMAISDLIVVMNKGRLAQLGTPEQVYRQPCDSFVASFIGRASLIPVEILERLEGAIAVKSMDGTKLIVSCKAKQFDENCHKFNIVIRPEEIVISEQPVEGRNCLSAVIDAIAYLGASTRVTAQTNGATITISTSSHPTTELRSGAPIYLTWAPDQCVVVPRESSTVT